MSLTGDYSMATPYSIRVPLEPGVLKKGGNRICISVLEGSWILFDRIALEGDAPAAVCRPEKVFIRDIAAADYEIPAGKKNVLPLIVDVEHLSGEPVLNVELDGKEIFSSEVEKGRYQFEVPMPAVKKRKGKPLFRPVRRQGNSFRQCSPHSGAHRDPGRLCGHEDRYSTFAVDDSARPLDAVQHGEDEP